MARTNAELKKAFGAIIYEMLMLESAAQQAERGAKKYDGLPFGDDEAAYLAGLVKVRSLHDFLADQFMKQFEKKTVRVVEFANGAVWNPPTDVKAFRNFANGFVAHIGWERVHKPNGKPTRNQLKKYGRILLQQAEVFVEQNKNVYGFTKRSVKYYKNYQKLRGLG
jgi:hypothetical protein